MKFRADLNAMRAYAVVCVVLFHFKLGGLAGGFIGVDVFFVLSGFLMTSLACKSMGAPGYRFWPFWRAFMWARTRRIVPGLLAMLAMVLLIGAFLAPPEAFADLGLHALSSALFYSNFVYAQSTGYFQGPSAYLWLMHTWSLSLEWQFYLLLPLGLAMLHRLGASQRTVLCTLLLAALVSLGLNLWAINRFPGLAFYWLPFRAWELLAGAVVAVCLQSHPARHASPNAARCGWLILAASPFVLGNLAWPGGWTLIPVGACMLILAAQDQAEPAWWRQAWVQKIGLWSYAIYLFHWPVQVMLSYLGLDGQVWWRLAGAAASLALGYLGHTFIEVPSRAWLQTGAAPRSRMPGLKLAPGLSVVLMAAAWIMHTDGLPRRHSGEVGALEAAQYNYNPRGECLTHSKSALAIHQCVHGPAQHVGLLVWGDSHGDAVMPAIAQSVEVGVEFSGHAGCAPVLGISHKGERCAAFSKLAYARINEAPGHLPVLIVGRLSDYLVPLEPPGFNAAQWMMDTWRNEQERNRQAFLDALQTTLCTLSQKRMVYVMRPLPEMDAPVPLRAAVTEIIHGGFDDDLVSLPVEQMARRHQLINSTLDQISRQCPNVTVLDPYPHLCADGRCRGIAQGEPLYIDRDHLSLAGGQKLAPMFRAGLGRVEALALRQ